MKKFLISILIAIFVGSPEIPVLSNAVQNHSQENQAVLGVSTNKILASQEMSMDYRYRVPSVSKVFKDNILLNIAYLDGRVKSPSDINWTEIDKPFHSEFTLQPDQAFAFHDAVMPQFKDKVVVTTKAHFNAKDGFKSDGYLFGDGVCQLASLINWAARSANLDVTQYTNHDFAAIPEVPKQFGVAIYYDPNSNTKSARENLYIVNNQDKPITFHFDYDGSQLKVSVSKA